MYLFALHFRHEILHRERAALTRQPNFRHARRERLPQVSAHNTTYCRVPQSSLSGSDDPCLSLNEISSFVKEPCFVQRLSVPFIFILNGFPLSVPGTLLPPAAVTRLQLFRIKNSPSYNQILVYILHPADLTEQARSLLLSSAREQKHGLEMG